MMFHRIAFALLLAFLATTGRAWGGGLPERIAPNAPFPLVLSETFEQTDVAPGVRLGCYYLMTNIGPLVIHALSVDPHEPTVRINTVLANDTLISKGESLSSMAQRTGAVAGLNADYFDIGNTYQPIGVVIQNGTLLRSPSGRAVMTIGKDRNVHFGTLQFSGNVQDADGRSWQLTTFNEWPPQKGVSLLTPTIGPIPAQPETMLALLTPSTNAHYRVRSILDANVAHEQLNGLALAFGPAAINENGIPEVGDTIGLSFDTDPPLADIETAVGGGPRLLADGNNYDDPLPPAPHEAMHLDPLSGAFRQNDGTLVLVQVDGREPHISIGLTRPAFAALMRALGGIDGMAFDGGGSSTIVARVPGDRVADVQNTPSDGHARPVSDGILIYSDAPIGPPARLAVRHGAVRVLQGAIASIDTVVTDAAGHLLDLPSAPVRASVMPASLAKMLPDGRLLAGSRAANGFLHIERDGLPPTNVPLVVLNQPASLRIEPEDPNPQPGQHGTLRALAFDASGAPIIIDGQVNWSASKGTGITQDGAYVAGTSDGIVLARVAGREARVTVRVGQHELPIDAFRHDGPAARAWSFSSAPADQPGSVEIDSDDALALNYDFTGTERVAYANIDMLMEGALLALSVDVQGNADGSTLRLAVTSPDGDRIPVTVARNIDWRGWRTLIVKLPRAASAPKMFNGFYLVAPHTTSADASGTLALRNVRGIFAGTSVPLPPYRLP